VLGGAPSVESKLCSVVSAPAGVPYAGLVQAANGDFYGTTPNGGANNYGTVFKIVAQLRLD